MIRAALALALLALLLVLLVLCTAGAIDIDRTTYIRLCLVTAMSAIAAVVTGVRARR